MPADNETGRRAHMFAAVQSGTILCVAWKAKYCREDIGRTWRRHGDDTPEQGWAFARKCGVRIVPVIVTIEDKANDR